MSDKVMKSFEVGRMNPYHFRFVSKYDKLCLLLLQSHIIIAMIV